MFAVTEGIALVVLAEGFPWPVPSGGGVWRDIVAIYRLVIFVRPATAVRRPVVLLALAPIFPGNGFCLPLPVRFVAAMSFVVWFLVVGV